MESGDSMKPVKSLCLVLALAGGLSAADIAWANHGGPHFVARHGYVVHHGWHRPIHGPGFYGPWPWFYPSWYIGYGVPIFPTTIYTEAAPPVQYVEMNPPVTTAPGNPSDNPPANVQPNMWYYCSNPQGYYPYVQSCSTGWQAVVAQPPKQ